MCNLLYDLIKMSAKPRLAIFLQGNSSASGRHHDLLQVGYLAKLFSRQSYCLCHMVQDGLGKDQEIKMHKASSCAKSSHKNNNTEMLKTLIHLQYLAMFHQSFGCFSSVRLPFFDRCRHVWKFMDSMYHFFYNIIPLKVRHSL